MNKFKIGDRIQGNSQCIRPQNIGRRGVVAGIDSDGDLSVKWDGLDYAGAIEAAKVDLIREAKPQGTALPLDSAERKRYPLYAGLLAYFPAALAQVAHHSFLGNEKHNPGLPLQHARGVSGDHADCIIRHLIDSAEHPAGSAKRVEELRALCWRGLALLQEEMELAGAPAAPAATFDRSKK